MNLEKSPVVNTTSKEYSDKIIPIKKFVLYSILSMNFYLLYWIYKNWQYIKEENNVKLTPLLRTIFFMYFSGSMARYALDMAKSENYQKKFSSIIVFAAVFVLTASRKLPEPYNLLSILLFLPLIPVVQAFNFYWEKKEPHLKVNNKFSASSIILMIIGGIILSFSILGYLLPDDLESKIEIIDESK